jgi:nucleoside-diphosphate-sugar epimerase
MLKKQPLKVHITGVYGLIGNLMYRHLNRRPEHYDVYGSGRRAVSSHRAGEKGIQMLPEDHFRIADLSDALAINEALSGMDAVLHIAATPDPAASFEETVNSNIMGTYHVLEACREAGIKRLVFASSIMVSNGYFRHTEPYKAIRDSRWDDIPEKYHIITHHDPVRPTEPYSASKVYGEAICRTYHDSHQISTVCLRIGYVNKEDLCSIPFANSMWFSHHDCANLIELALEATSKSIFEICYGVSDNQYRWVDIEHSREVLGFIPKDSHEERYATKFRTQQSE